MTPSQIAARLREAGRILVVTHMKPDGDAAGSSLGLVRALNLMPGKRAEAAYAGPMPAWLHPLRAGTPTRIWERDGGPSEEPDAIVVIDTGSWSQLEAFRSYLEPRASRAIIVDHHRRGDTGVAAGRWIDVESAAACQMAAGLCCLLLGCMPEHLPHEVAVPLYLGLATDTGWFKHSNVTSGVMRLAGDLLDTGVDANALYQAVEQQDTPARLRLLSRALSSLVIEEDGRIGLVRVTRRDLAETGASTSDTGGFVDLPQTIASVKASVFLIEADPEEFAMPAGTPLTKVSVRTKTDLIDADLACRALGGGGHRRAAGARVQATLDEAARLILAELAPMVRAMEKSR
jgi:phosphoesterase RecJ-like protein